MHRGAHYGGLQCRTANISPVHINTDSRRLYRCTAHARAMHFDANGGRLQRSAANTSPMHVNSDSRGLYCDTAHARTVHLDTNSGRLRRRAPTRLSMRFQPSYGRLHRSIATCGANH